MAVMKNKPASICEPDEDSLIRNQVKYGYQLVGPGDSFIRVTIRTPIWLDASYLDYMVDEAAREFKQFLALNHNDGPAALGKVDL